MDAWTQLARSGEGCGRDHGGRAAQRWLLRRRMCDMHAKWRVVWAAWRPAPNHNAAGVVNECGTADAGAWMDVDPEELGRTALQQQRQLPRCSIVLTRPQLVRSPMRLQRQKALEMQ